jgi:hypothetical protein
MGPSEKMFLSKHPAVKKLKATGEELGLPKADIRLSLGLRALMDVMHGRGNVDISGEDNLIGAAERAKEKNRGLVVITSHESGLDVPTASYLASLVGKTSIGIASTNGDWIKEGVGGFNPEPIQYVLTGRENFIPVPYKWTDRKNKKPAPFSEDDYKEAVERVKDGEILVMAGFSDHESVEHRKIGSAAAHIALEAGVEILPISISSDKAEDFSGGPSTAVLKDHNLKITIGDSRDNWLSTIQYSYTEASPETKKAMRNKLKKILAKGSVFKRIVGKGNRHLPKE